MRMQGYCDVYKWTTLNRTLPEVKCLHPTSSRREMCMSRDSKVIFHKFLHGTAFYTLNDKNVSDMLEFNFKQTAHKASVMYIKTSPYCLSQVKKYQYNFKITKQTVILKQVWHFILCWWLIGCVLHFNQ